MVCKNKYVKTKGSMAITNGKEVNFIPCEVQLIITTENDGFSTVTVIVGDDRAINIGFTKEIKKYL